MVLKLYLCFPRQMAIVFFFQSITGFVYFKKVKPNIGATSQSSSSKRRTVYTTPKDTKHSTKLQLTSFLPSANLTIDLPHYYTSKPNLRAFYTLKKLLLAPESTKKTRGTFATSPTTLNISESLF